MKIHFYKYQGAGNDFVVIDGRKENHLNIKQLPATFIANLCDRRFGIGADGLMILLPHPDFNFEMLYYNSDGNRSSFCGNGGRCIAAFAHHLGLIGNETNFLAADGPHNAIVSATENSSELHISLGMNDVNEIRYIGDDVFLNTGSPHYVKFVEDPDKADVFGEGRQIRNSDLFAPSGTNVNFVNVQNGIIQIRTYERGVEDETLACGTGITAAAIASFLKGNVIPGSARYQIKAKGGNLSVS